MNNITKDNMEPRSSEIRDRVLPDYLPWFANYMVVKRAAQVGTAGRLQARARGDARLH